MNNGRGISRIFEYFERYSVYVYIGVAIAVFILGGMCLLGGEKELRKLRAMQKEY